MGNTNDKTHGGRGQPLGSSQQTVTDKKPTTVERVKKKVTSKKKQQKQAQKKAQYAQNRANREADIREQRLKNVNLNNKNVYVSSELKKKEKMLHIMNAADAKATGQQAPTAPKHMQYEQATTSISPKSSKQSNNKGNSSQSSLYMADPSSKEALAAEKRIQQKTLKKVKNIDERKNRTRDLLFGDGLKTKEEEFDASQYNDSNVGGGGGGKQGVGNNNKPAQFYKSDKDVPLSSNSNTASAALKRFDQQKSNRVINQKDRKNRTMKLLHGDVLKDQNEVKAEPRQRTYNDDIDPDVAEVHQSILNLNNCNPHEKMPATAKLLRKVVTNLLKAETKEDQEKYGKLRLTQKKIKAAFVDVEYGVETLEALGFRQQKAYNEKEMKMDDYVVFDFMNINHKALIHVMDLLNEYYPEQQ